MTIRRTPPRLLLAAALLAVVLTLAACSRQPAATPADPGVRPLPVEAVTEASGPSYPRLALWWPDIASMSASEAARYDMLILHDFNAEHVKRLRAAAPDLKLLNSTNACELGYEPGNDRRNRELAKIPAQWLLQQVGTKLASAVDEKATRLPIEAVTGAGGTYLFVEGDTAVIGDEIVKVERVDHAARILTVRRGTVKPPTAHPAGQRVAAAISFYPNSLVLDLTANCPPGRAVDSTRTETWAEYAARKDARLVADPMWSGIMTDRAQVNAGWLVDRRRARSIDVDRSGRVVKDYDAFDDQWNAGILAYERRLRALLGDRILLSNWGMPNHELLNGQIFEAFPQDTGRSYTGTWRETVFGPLFGRGGYLQWTAKARKPHATLVTTYRTDHGQGDDSGPIGAADYRKMRFGFTTALLGDGYFGYQVNAKDRDGLFHASLYSTWFDEYDGGGVGRGYLGRALGGPKRAVPALATPDLLRIGGFEAGDKSAWTLNRAGIAGADFALDKAVKHDGASAARVVVTKTDGAAYRVALRSTPLTVAAKTDHTVSFWARADEPRRVSAWLQDQGDHAIVEFGEVEIGTEWRRYELSGQAARAASGASLHLGLGQSEGTVWLDGVKLQHGSAEVWRRDFERGVSVVNATNVPQQVDLGRGYRRIVGFQDPVTNDGSVVESITLPPLDGLVLLTP